MAGLKSSYASDRFIVDLDDALVRLADGTVRRAELHGFEAHGKTAHPIVNFDKTDRSTLESFNSLAG